MAQIIEIIVDNNKYQIEWALSEHFSELKGMKFMLNKMVIFPNIYDFIFHNSVPFLSI